MNILWFDALTGKIVNKAVVDFGVPSTSSQSEQSVVISGYKAVVVNNWFNDKDVSIVCKIYKKYAIAHDLSTKGPQGCPFFLGGHALGVQQFEIDPKDGTVKSTWSRNDISCTSSIPVVSETDNTFYCVGKRGTQFTVEVVDWMTGKQKWFKELGMLANPFYAGNEIGTNGDYIVGTLTGPVRVTDPKQGQEMF